MTTHSFADTLRPVEALDALIARHGLIRVVLAVPAAILKRRRDRTLLAHSLSPHLLRDIGLREDRSAHWERR